MSDMRELHFPAHAALGDVYEVLSELLPDLGYDDVGTHYYYFGQVPCLGTFGHRNIDAICNKGNGYIVAHYTCYQYVVPRSAHEWASGTVYIGIKGDEYTPLDYELNLFFPSKQKGTRSSPVSAVEAT